MQYPTGIKAEVLINLLLRFEQAVHYIRVVFEGNFKRNYLDDVHKIDKSNSTSNKLTYTIYLNRDGIYDKLPEGLFHRIDRFVRLEETVDSKTFKEEFEAQKNEIIHSRKFFQPLEDEFFKKAVQIEAGYSNKITYPFKSLSEFFFKGINKFELNEMFSDQVISFLPYIPKIRGNIQKLRFFLMSVLQTRISIEQHEKIKSYTVTNHSQKYPLGIARLGKDFYCGSQFIDHCMQWKITIYAQDEKLLNYISNKQFVKFFDFVKTFLVPAGIEVEHVIKSIYLKQLTLRKIQLTENAMYLGYNICI